MINATRLNAFVHDHNTHCKNDLTPDKFGECKDCMNITRSLLILFSSMFKDAAFDRQKEFTW